jgi:predicted pyridoxine 5'-phosphate oxidase superfamily flavin-nucleotide-binding protein
MGHRFAEIAFTDAVRRMQEHHGSRRRYAAMEEADDRNHALGAREADFIAARDSFYMATVSETGWPYVQHRGGPPGFLKVLDQRTLGFADFRGNRQYVSVGNLLANDRVSLILVNYPDRQRLKVLGRARLVDDDERATLARLELDDYRAPVERGLVIHVEAFDWNCPQHITPRYSMGELRAMPAPLEEDERTAQDPAGP